MGTKHVPDFITAIEIIDVYSMCSNQCELDYKQRSSSSSCHKVDGQHSIISADNTISEPGHTNIIDVDYFSI